MFIVQYYCPAEDDFWRSPRNNRRIPDIAAAVGLAQSLCPQRGGARVLDLDGREVYLCVGPFFSLGRLPLK